MEKKLGLRERRIAVLKDVLKSLRLEKYKATTGAYISSTYKAIDSDLSKDLKDILPKVEKKPCQVCALGSIFLSAVRKFDNFPVTCAIEWAGRSISIDQDDMHLHLINEKLWSRRQLLQVESAFERWSFCSKSRSAVKFGRKYRDDNKRLRAIVRNMIQNNGVFYPSKGLRKQKV